MLNVHLSNRKRYRGMNKIVRKQIVEWVTTENFNKIPLLNKICFENRTSHHKINHEFRKCLGIMPNIYDIYMILLQKLWNLLLYSPECRITLHKNNQWRHHSIVWHIILISRPPAFCPSLKLCLLINSKHSIWELLVSIQYVIISENRSSQDQYISGFVS